jgi:hypothetical protein
MHASSHLEGSMRHAQLELAGAPTIRETFVRGVPLWIGTLMHLDIHRMLDLAGVTYQAEVDLTPGMPRGWGGTGDILAFTPDGYTLIDVKSTNGRAVKYLIEDGAKSEHIKQASAYYHAAADMGYRLTPQIGVYYVPKEDNAYAAEPLLSWFDPIPKDELWPLMEARRALVDGYLASIPREGAVVPCVTGDIEIDRFLTPWLEPVQERVQKCYFDKATETWSLKLCPHWSTSYCAFPSELCDCREQGYTLIGMYDVDGVTYYPRTGYEHIEPTVVPA